MLVILEALAIGYLIVNKPTSPVIKLPPILRPFLQYTYTNLKTYKPVDSPIRIDKEIRSGDEFTSYLFYFTTKDNKRVSGLINIPKKSGNFPVVVLIRGFVDPTVYVTGTGTQHVGEYFASNGFITVAPDFLGYGKSDKSSPNAFEDRFLTYTTVIDLLSSLKNINAGLSMNGISDITVDSSKVGIWAHSNGGQIALSVAEITGFTYPLVLWAPVSAPFPYSILYYTNEFDDRGKALRKALAQFEQNYDVEDYSLANYFGWIKAPIQLHQGLSDEEVPVAWSDMLNKNLTDKKIRVQYYTYPGENHNFQNGNWTTAVIRSLDFVSKNIETNQ